MILVIESQHDRGTNNFVKRIFLGPKDEVKSPSNAKHEERTQRNAELDEFSINEMELSRIL